jgi:hypothetical protein
VTYTPAAVIHRRRATDRLTYANVVATVALFIALGGVSYAAVALPANSVGSTQLQTGAVHLRALSFPLGAASAIDQKVEEIGNGACNGPLFPGETPPPCVAPARSYSAPGHQLRVSVHSAGRLLISAVAGLNDRGAPGASAEVTVRVIVDESIESEAQTKVTSGQIFQVPAQALVPVSAGAHTIGLSVEADYSSRPENVLVAPVSIIATALPAAAERPTVQRSTRGSSLRSPAGPRR